MRQISDKTALENYSDNIERARWHSKAIKEARVDRYANMRLRKDVFEPIINNKLAFDKSTAFFAMGSCFAREVETALSDLGMNVLSVVQKGVPIRFGRGGYTNRYNTASMLNEIKFAFGLQQFDSRSVVAVDAERARFIDLHSHPAGGLAPYDEVLSRRDVLREHFSQMAQADVFVVTLGLLETWFDKLTGQYINISPATGKIFEFHPDRFEFRILSHADNMANLEEIFSIMKKISPKMKFIVTTSPVPLLATFSERDVVIANTYSKSTLRSCAEQWCWSHPGEIEYFPSYEMAINSNPDLVWKADRIHVQPVFVRQIMKQFVGHYVRGAEASLAATPEELEDMKATIAEGRAERRSLGLLQAGEDASAPAAGAPESPAEIVEACKRAFNRKDFEGCIRYGEQLLEIYDAANEVRRGLIRKHVAVGSRFACLASFRVQDVERAMTFYERALSVRQPYWELGIRAAKQLLKRGESRRLGEVVEQLRAWSSRNPQHKMQFEQLLKLSNRGPARARPLAQASRAS